MSRAAWIMRLGDVAIAALAATVFSSVASAAALTVNVRSLQGAPVSDAVVFLEPERSVAAPAPARATIDQRSRQFVPRVSVLQRGTVVLFPNSDNVRHHVYSFSPAKTFDLRLYAGTTAEPVTFDQAGLVVLGCNIHDSMIAYVAVVDTPYFGRTDASGSLQVSLPAGSYRLRLWHPDLLQPAAPESVLMTDAARALTLTAAIAPEPTGSAPWPQ
jgi:plastocyanin